MNAALPGLGLLSLTTELQNALISQSPAEIINGIEKKLSEMGVWEPVARQFCHEPHGISSIDLQGLPGLMKMADHA